MAGFVKFYLINNGGIMEKFYIYACDKCGFEIMESDIHYIFDSKRFCPECSFRLGYITGEKYARDCGIYLKNIKSGIDPITNEIEITTNKKFSWEKIDRDHRQSIQYKNWRTNVFERDDYTCKICGKHGGELEAHHINEFSKYPKERYNLENGITLCKKCHREYHGKGKNGNR